MILIFLMLGLVACFYAYTFVNFQKEIAGIRRGKLVGAVTIPLHVQHCQENEPEWFSQLSQEIYQVESPYLGPLFLVPRRNESVSRSARAAHARLVSAMYPTAGPGQVHRKNAAASSRVDSEQGNVIRITEQVSARS